MPATSHGPLLDPDDESSTLPTDAAEAGPSRTSGSAPDGPDVPPPSVPAVPEAPPETAGETDAEPGAWKRGARAAEPPPVPPPPERLDGAVESMLLASGEALTAERLRDLLGVPSAVHVREALGRIRERWAAAGLSIEIQDVAGGHRVTTRPEYAEYVRRLWRRPAADRLSATLLETLSIVAYKQPVARAEIERIRGVQCGDALRGLLDRRLLKVAGRSDQPGRPLLYATTARFLEVFGLAGLEDLPNARELRL